MKFVLCKFTGRAEPILFLRVYPAFVFIPLPLEASGALAFLLFVFISLACIPVLETVFFPTGTEAGGPKTVAVLLARFSRVMWLLSNNLTFFFPPVGQGPIPGRVVSNESIPGINPVVPFLASMLKRLQPWAG